MKKSKDIMKTEKMSAVDHAFHELEMLETGLGRTIRVPRTRVRRTPTRFPRADRFKLNTQKAFRISDRGRPIDGLGELGISNPLDYLPNAFAEAKAKIGSVGAKIQRIPNVTIRQQLMGKLNILINSYNNYARIWANIQNSMRSGAKIIQDAATGTIKTAQDAVSYLRSFVPKGIPGISGLGVAPIVIYAGALIALATVVAGIITALNYLDGQANIALQQKQVEARKEQVKTNAQIVQEMTAKGYSPEQISQVLQASGKATEAGIPEAPKSLVEKTIEPFIQLGMLGIGAFLAIKLVPMIISGVADTKRSEA